jgi:RNA polymerase sigma-70 factor, ECF subfamily
MTMPISPALASARAEFEKLIKGVRPDLHRYVAHMIGSVVDAEDVVQEVLAKAYYSLTETISESNLRGWLFRIAHNKAIDHLRRYDNKNMEQFDEQILKAEPDLPLEEKELVAIALAVFVKLAPRQRAGVILKDVLGYSLAEISEILNATVPEIKALLHRGRSRLRELATSVEAGTTALDDHERELLYRYAALFNARDFDTVRAMLAEEVRVDVIGRAKLHGVDDVVNNYFHNYQQTADWFLSPGVIEGRPAILVYDPNEASDQPTYFMLITWDKSQASLIRDYRYARYVMPDTKLAGK